MARGFGSTFGSGSSDEISTGYSTAQSSNLSISAWYYKNSTGGSGTGSVWNQFLSSNSGNLLSCNSSNSAMRYINAAVGGNSIWTFNDNGLDAWTHICATSAFSTNGKPVVYINGSSVTVSGGSAISPG